MLWCETGKPDINEARRFAEGIHAKFPGKLLAYNCSPSFNWASKLDNASMQRWREDLAALGYRFQFITLAGWHALNLSMFELASAYREDGMLGYSNLQRREFSLEKSGYRPTKHQAFVGTGYFDAVQTVVTAFMPDSSRQRRSVRPESGPHLGRPLNPGVRTEIR